MRIERPNQVNPLNPYQQQNMKQEEVKQKAAGRDQVEISPEAMELQRSKETEAERAERIAKLKEQVQAGTYHVDAKLLAEKLIERGL
ncbi:flagellar biosynthesis anti-sigma factor FlgM [Aneurinibacillus tyrosinisolvens]|uniref:flagellar biosynthesis anti-sigma factor FlgM n=1 Tax=Aneurinibacillus tyrosinisolvens TaxID=1443435 RepID=UPI00063F0CF5|nr:flagellar biosynthesis anti-sigma factor FlgM [Aneurinibacillus tyrosinisolvens]